ncbi:MAG: SGNH/GDSL hydrolase family protein [Lachnospiraceae bacterium]|nr:SGNH/GDSL hydrolase family protein [Lachnospiraceae bacterium]
MKKCRISCSAFLFFFLLLGALIALPRTASAEKNASGKAVISEAYARQDGSIRLVLSGKEKSSCYLVYRASKKDGKYKEIGKTKKGKYIDKDVKVYHKYWYKTTSAVKSGSEYIPGKMSKAVFVKARKPAKKMKLAYAGDSLIVGITKYGHMKAKKERVIAKIGINTIRYYQSSYQSQLRAYNPDQLVIMMGINGIEGKPGNGYIRKQVEYFERILKSLLKKNPNMEIILSGITPYKRHGNATAAGRKWYNKRLKKLAKKYDGVWYCDPGKVFDNGSGYIISKYAAGDYHLKSFGYTKLVEFWRKFVKELKYK